MGDSQENPFQKDINPINSFLNINFLFHIMQLLNFSRIKIVMFKFLNIMSCKKCERNNI